MSENSMDTDVLVIGAGPGGYTAAFRAADLGQRVVLVDSRATLGGVCLNVGCIPSKALLHASQVVTDAESMSKHGIRFAAPELDLKSLRRYKDRIVGKLTRGLAGLARQRKVEVVNGQAEFSGPNAVQVVGSDSTTEVRFDHCIIAAGSSPIRIPGFPYDDPRLMDSTGALALEDIPDSLLVIGGGIIGLEMATVYDALGSEVSVVEQASHLIADADDDLVAVLEARMKGRLESVMTDTSVTQIESTDEGLKVYFNSAEDGESYELYDRVLYAVGRSPNGRLLAAEAAGVAVDERGFIAVNDQCQTNVPHIYAIGDIIGGPMLAHKATHEGRMAAELIAGKEVPPAASVIPSIAYTNPEIAWAGLTEKEAKAKGVVYEKGAFPWAASGRALANGRDDGLTKLLIDPNTHRLLGVGIVGVNAGELLAEAVLALETEVDFHTLMHTVHAHPTLSESTALAAEIVDGSITDLYMPKGAA